MGKLNLISDAKTMAELKLPFTGDHSEPKKTVYSDRMGMSKGMLASVGNLRGDTEMEMATLDSGILS